mmetsp:Transcript_106537/g.258814  ORF Transcript_106537/g.258814 Transcript_106537/m.258814 type:complete len:255 (+) Transcript_106537:3-767(+)
MTRPPRPPRPRAPARHASSLAAAAARLPLAGPLAREGLRAEEAQTEVQAVAWLLELVLWGGELAAEAGRLLVPVLCDGEPSTARPLPAPCAASAVAPGWPGELVAGLPVVAGEGGGGAPLAEVKGAASCSSGTEARLPAPSAPAAWSGDGKSRPLPRSSSSRRSVSLRLQSRLLLLLELCERLLPPSRAPPRPTDGVVDSAGELTKARFPRPEPSLLRSSCTAASQTPRERGLLQVPSSSSAGPSSLPREELQF